MATILDLHDELLARVFALSVHLGPLRGHITPKLRICRRLAALASLCKQAFAAVNSTACCMQLLSARFMRENGGLTPRQLFAKYFRPIEITAWYDDVRMARQVRVYTENNINSLRHEIASRYGLTPCNFRYLYVNGVMADRDAVIPQPHMIRITSRPHIMSGVTYYDADIDVHDCVDMTTDSVTCMGLAPSSD